MSKGNCIRTRSKRDDVESVIVQTLRKHGYKVWPVSDAGFPDLYVEDPDGHGLLAECKSPGGKLTPLQETRFTYWTAHGGRPVLIVTSGADALRQIRARAQGASSDG